MSMNLDYMIVRKAIDRIKIKLSIREQSNFVLRSYIEPTYIDEALSNEEWIMIVQKDLNQFHKNEI